MNIGQTIGTLQEAPISSPGLIETPQESHDRLEPYANLVIQSCSDIVDYLLLQPADGFEVRQRRIDHDDRRPSIVGPKRAIGMELGAQTDDDQAIVERALEELEGQGIIDVLTSTELGQISRRVTAVRINPDGLAKAGICYITDEIRLKLSMAIASGEYVAPVNRSQEAARINFEPQSVSIVVPVPEKTPLFRNKLEALQEDDPDVRTLLANALLIARSILKNDENMTRPDSDTILTDLASWLGEEDTQLIEQTLRLVQDRDWIAIELVGEDKPQASIMMSDKFLAAVKQQIEKRLATQ
jgi:hypothetical protein